MFSGSFSTRHLDQDAIGSLTLDRCLPRAQLVDPAPHHLQRLADRGLPQVGALGIGQAQHNALTLRVRVEILNPPGGPERGGVQFGYLGQRLVALRHIGQRQGHAVALNAQTSVANAGRAQGAADVANHRLQPLAIDRRDVDLEQKIGTALQIQAQRDGAVGQKSRQAVAGCLREEIGQQRQDPEQANGDNDERPPGRKLGHSN